MAARQPTKPAAADGFVSRKSEIATAETVPTTGSIRWKLASMMPTRSSLACGKSGPSATSWTGSGADLLRAGAGLSA
jgi:hypothetical protein